MDRIDDDLVIATVRWPWLDALGDEVGEESSTYTLRRGSDGQIKMCVAVMRDASPRH